MFKEWFERRAKIRQAADDLYERALVQSRLPVFYQDFAIPDSMDGRFDCLSLHVCLLMERFTTLPKAKGKVLSQRVFDNMFKGADTALRESGVGDLGVPKHMQKMMKAFNGRLHVYHAALVAGDHDGLAKAIMRNVYRSDAQVPHEHAKQMANYMMMSYVQMAQISDADVMQGALIFPMVDGSIKRDEAA